MRASPAALLALVTVNLIPLAGVLFFGWSLFGVLLLYWLESGIIGLFNVPRILLAQGGPSAGGWRAEATAQPACNTVGQRIGTTVFFLIHYGGFWLGHLFLLLLFLGESLTDSAVSPTSEAPPYVFYLTVGMLVLSHGLSFAFNYVGRQEYRTALPFTQMWAPYGRVFVMHLSTLGGGFLLDRFGSPLWALALLVGLKTVLDVGSHLVAHHLALDRATPAT